CLIPGAEINKAACGAHNELSSYLKHVAHQNEWYQRSPALWAQLRALYSRAHLVYRWLVYGRVSGYAEVHLDYSDRQSLTQCPPEPHPPQANKWAHPLNQRIHRKHGRHGLGIPAQTDWPRVQSHPLLAHAAVQRLAIIVRPQGARGSAQRPCPAHQ